MSQLFPVPRRAHCLETKQEQIPNPDYLPPESLKPRSDFEGKETGVSALQAFNVYAAKHRDRLIISTTTVCDEEVVVLGVSQDSSDGDIFTEFLVEYTSGTVRQVPLSSITFLDPIMLVEKTKLESAGGNNNGSDSVI